MSDYDFLNHLIHLSCHTVDGETLDIYKDLDDDEKHKIRFLILKLKELNILAK